MTLFQNPLTLSASYILSAVIMMDIMTGHYHAVKQGEIRKQIRGQIRQTYDISVGLN